MFVRAARQRGSRAAPLVFAACVGTVGCVSSYDYPDVKTPGPSEASVAVWKRTTLAVEVIPREERGAFLDGFRSYGAPAFAVDTVPERGRYVRVSVLEIEPSIGAAAWGKVAAETYFILPAYSDSSGYDVTFDTYLNGAPIHHYTYATRATTWVWAGLAPVAWVNLLTPSRGDAFAGIARCFLADNAVNGFIQPSDEGVRAIVATRAALDEPEPTELLP